MTVKSIKRLLATTLIAGSFLVTGNVYATACSTTDPTKLFKAKLQQLNIALPANAKTVAFTPVNLSKWYVNERYPRFTLRTVRRDPAGLLLNKLKGEHIKGFSTTATELVTENVNKPCPASGKRLVQFTPHGGNDQGTFSYTVKLCGVGLSTPYNKAKRAIDSKVWNTQIKDPHAGIRLIKGSSQWKQCSKYINPNTYKMVSSGKKTTTQCESKVDPHNSKVLHCYADKAGKYLKHPNHKLTKQLKAKMRRSFTKDHIKDFLHGLAKHHDYASLRKFARGCPKPAQNSRCKTHTGGRGTPGGNCNIIAKKLRTLHSAKPPKGLSNVHWANVLAYPGDIPKHAGNTVSTFEVTLSDTRKCAHEAPPPKENTQPDAHWDSFDNDSNW